MMIFVCEVQMASVNVVVYLNDVIVLEDRAAAPKTTQVKLNPYVIEGRNSVRVDLAPLLSAPAFQIRILVGEHGREPDASGYLGEFRLDATLLKETRWREVWWREFVTSQAFGRWKWQDAPRRDLSSDDRDAIRRLLGETARVLQSRDASASDRLVEIKTDEMSRALGIDRTEYEAEQHESMQSLLSAPDWTLSPVNPDQTMLTPNAGGRLVTVTGPDGSPLLRGSAGGRQFSLPVTVSPIAGRWQIVR